MNPRLTPLAAALSIAFVTPVQAQSADLDPVIVSATRFSEADTNVAANVSVITRDDIERHRTDPRGRPIPGLEDVWQVHQAMGPNRDHNVKPEQIEAIWAYIGSVNGWPAATK